MPKKEQNSSSDQLVDGREGSTAGVEGVSAAGASASDTALDGLSHIFTPREQKHFWQNSNTFGKRIEQKIKTMTFT